MTKILASILLSILLGLCLHTRLMASSLPQTGTTDVAIQNNVELVDHLGGQIYGIYPYGNLVYTIIGPDFSVLDVSDPTRPTRIGYITNAGYQSDITVSGNYAFVSAGYEGMYVIDVSLPTQPHLLNTFKSSGYATGLTKFMNFVLLTYVLENGGSSGFQIIDISNSNQPRSIADIKIADFVAHDITIKDNYAYIVGSKSVGDLDDDGVMRIYDLQTPQSPQQLGDFYDSAEGFHRIEIKGNYAYIPIAYVGLDIIDISNPKAPTLSQALSVAGGYIGDLAISENDNQLYATSGSSPNEGGFHVFDIAHAPHITQTAYLSGTLYNRLAVSGTLAFVDQYSKGLEIIDHVAQKPLGFFSTQPDLDAFEWAHDSKIRNGNYLYQLISTERANDTLQILNISSPNNPVEIAKYFSPNIWFYSLAVQENKVFVSFLDIFESKHGLLVFDVEQPFIDQPISRIEMPTYGEIYSMVVKGRYLFLSDYYTVGPTNTPQSSLRIFDLIDVNHPKIITSYDTGREIQRIAINDNIAYLLFWQSSQDPACRGGLSLIDISIIDHPKESGEICWSRSNSAIIVENGYAYIAGGNNGINIIDVSIPLAPKIAGSSLLTQGAGRIAKSNNLIAIDDWVNGLFLFKFHPPTVSATITNASIITSSIDSTVYRFSSPPLGLKSTFTHTVRYVDNDKAFPQSLIGIGHYFSNEFDVPTESRKPDFIHPYTVTIHYSDSEVQRVTESTLAIYYWNGTQWQQNLTSNVDPVTNQITATLSKEGVWGVGGQFLSQNYLPIISNN